jgi:hypothetical protein
MFSTNRTAILNRHRHYLQIEQKEIPHDPCHLGVSSDRSKTISEVVVRSAQTVHLSCVKIITIFERTKSSFHFSLVTYEYHCVHQKRFCVPMVRSAQTMHLSCVKISTIWNELSQASSWSLLPRSTIMCVPNDFWVYCMFSTNCAPILHRHQHYLQMDQKRFHVTYVTLEFHRVHPKWLLRLWYVRHKPCTYLAWRVALSLNGLDWASTWASSPRSTIGCVQNDFWACGTFGANRTPILRQD